MRFRVLGPLQVEDAGVPVRLPSENQRLLLALLLVDANRVVSTDALAEGIWKDAQPRHPAAAIQSLVYRLRRQMGGDEQSNLESRPPGYLLRVLPDELDALRFETLADVGGGLGFLLSEVMKSTPHLKGILFDLPEVVADAKTRPNRCARTASVPVGTWRYSGDVTISLMASTSLDVTR